MGSRGTKLSRQPVRVLAQHLTVRRFAHVIQIEVFDSQPWRLVAALDVPADDAEILIAALGVALQQARREQAARAAAA